MRVAPPCLLDAGSAHRGFCMHFHCDCIERNLSLVAIVAMSPKQSRWQVPSDLMDGTVCRSLFMTIIRAHESDGNQLDYVSSAYGSGPDIDSGMNGKEVNNSSCTYQFVNHLIWKIFDRLLKSTTTDIDDRCEAQCAYQKVQHASG